MEPWVGSGLKMNNHVGRDGLALTEQGLLSMGHIQEDLTFQSVPFVSTTLENEKKPQLSGPLPHLRVGN